MIPTHDTAAPLTAHARKTGESQAQLALALLDELDCGIVVCDIHGSVHLANQAARRELASKALLQQLDGVLRPAAGGSIDFDGALRKAAQRGLRSLVKLARGSDQLMVTMLPLRPQGVETALVLVVLGRRQPCSDLGLELLAGSYGLTLAERRVLVGLVRQATPREIALANKVQLSTVRTQISSIRTKFGTRSVDGLLLCAALVPPVASALRLASVPPVAAKATPMLEAA